MESAIYATLGLLLVAGLSGLGYLATRYHQTYRTVSLTIIYLTNAFVVLALAYFVGHAEGSTMILQFVEGAKIEEAIAARHAHSDMAFWLVMGPIGFSTVVWILGLVSDRIAKEKREANQKDNGGA